MLKTSSLRKSDSQIFLTRQLPLLETVREFYPFATLENTYVLAAQHVLETSTILFDNLFQLGLDPNNFSLIGKCYSTNPSVYSFLKTLDICPSSLEFDSTRSFDIQYRENIANFLRSRIAKILASGCKKLVVLDDGGELINSLNQIANEQILAADIEIIGIEQTSSGFAKLQATGLEFPVINIARSFVKLQLETHLIADNLIQSLEMALEDINFRPTKALVLGKGVIGSKIHEKLSSQCIVDSYDLLAERGSIKNFNDINFQSYNLIFGCSGNEVMNPLHFRFLSKNTVLASGSSSDREFCGVTFRNRMARMPKCHEHIKRNGVYLLNCGFPINFSNHYNLVDNDMYQLTRSLLLAGILQGCTQQADLPSSFIDLNHEVQRLITDKFFDLYPHFAEFASAPS